MFLPCSARHCNRYFIAHFPNTNIAGGGDGWIIMDGILLSTLLVSFDHANTCTEQKFSNSYRGGRTHFERGRVAAPQDYFFNHMYWSGKVGGCSSKTDKWRPLLVKISDKIGLQPPIIDGFRRKVANPNPTLDRKFLPKGLFWRF